MIKHSAIQNKGFSPKLAPFLKESICGFIP